MAKQLKTDHQLLKFAKRVDRYSTLREILEICGGNLDAKISIDYDDFNDEVSIRLYWSRLETDQERDGRVAKWQAAEDKKKAKRLKHQQEALAEPQSAKNQELEQSELALYQSLHAKYGLKAGDS
jgi:hypothetical protein